MAFGDRSTAPSKKSKKVSPPRGKGPLAPKPQGVFAAPVKAPSVKTKPAPVPRQQKATPGALDVLPAKKGQNSKPYRPRVVKPIVKQAKVQQARAQHETRDTKGDADRARAQAFLAAHPEILHPPKPSEHHGSLIGAITGAAKVGQEGAKLAGDAVSEVAPYVALTMAPAIVGTAHAVGAGETLTKIIRHGARDLVDIPANAIPSAYAVGKTAIHDPKAAVGMLADPYVQAAKHPWKSFVEHPVGTGLLAGGVKGGVGRGIGKTLRAAPFETTKRLGSTERAIESPGNIQASAPKPYSKDAITKARQVTVEKAKARKARKKGRPAPVRVMSEKDIQKSVDAEVAAGRATAGHNEKTAAHAAQKALGKKPSAVTSAVAQGLTDGSVADVQALIAHYRAKAGTLDGEALQRNHETVRLLEDALKSHDPVKVVAAAKAYSDVRAAGEAETVARGFVKPQVAEQTRLAGVAVRRHGVQTGAEAPKVARQTAKEARVVAGRGAKAARRDVTAANQNFEKAFANARVSVARPKASAEVRVAERDLRQARAKVAKLQRQKKGPDRSVTYSAQVKVARAAVRDANSKVVAARSRVRGVAPEAADALRNAIAGRDDALGAVSVARTAAKAARRGHIDVKEGIKQGAYIGPDGELIPLPVVRASKGPVEPVYVSHNPGGDVRPSAVPTEPPTVAVKAARSGKALDEGTIDLHPDRLIKQAADSQRKLDASKNYERFLDHFSHRKTKGGSPEVYGNTSTAEAAATALRNQSGIDWVAARTFDGNYHLVPKAAAVRLAQHAQHTDNFMGAFTRQWSKNVLAFSPRWLAGQAIEPGFRAAVGHAGPRSILTTRRVLKGIEKEHGPGAVDQFKARTMSSGLQSAALRPLEHAGAQREAGRLGKAVQAFAKAPGPKQLGQLYNLTTNLTMGTLNHLVQNPSQYAMVGKAIRDSDLMSKHTVKLSQAAIDDFVKNGGKDVNVMARLGREVERMNGKYNGFSPRLQAAIAGYTPFLAWTLSATNFLFNVLPRDHPVLTSLIASSNLATENWRKAHGLDFDPFARGQEGWLQGSIPGAGGSHLRLGRYVPFGLGNDNTPFLGPYADAILPQLSGVIAAVKGEDFTGAKLTGYGPSPSLAREAAAGATSIGKGVMPLATQLLTLAGVHTPDNADSRKVKPTVSARARGQFDPFMFTPGSGAAATAGSSSGKPGALPPGVSQAELDQLVRDAQQQARQPQVSQAEIDAILKASGR